MLLALALSAHAQTVEVPEVPPARTVGGALVFDHVTVTSKRPEPRVEILPVRQDVTTEATVPVADAPLLPKVEAAAGTKLF